MPALSFSESVYKGLPPQALNRLAETTAHQSAARSAYQLYKTLGQPEIGQTLATDAFFKKEFGQALQPESGLSFFSRVKLAARHFLYALTARYESISQALKAAIDRLPPKDTERTAAPDSDSDSDDESLFESGGDQAPSHRQSSKAGKAVATDSEAIASDPESESSDDDDSDWDSD